MQSRTIPAEPTSWRQPHDPKAFNLLMLGAAGLFMAGCLGCGQRLRIASPQIQRTPMITCIIIIDTPVNSEQAVKAASEVCRQALEHSSGRR